MIPRVNSWIRHITSMILFALAVGATVYGVSFAYLLHHGGNFLCVWLIGVHLSGSGGELGGVVRRLSAVGVGTGGDEKKQP